MRRRCSITSGTPPAMNTCTVGCPRGPFGSASTRRGVARLIADPVLDRRRTQPGRVRDRRNVQQQVRRSAERRVHEHRVLDRLLR